MGRPTTPTRPILAAAVALVLVSPAGTTATAPASIDGACDEDVVGFAEFTDVEATDRHTRAIDCLAHWGLVEGDDGAYAPGDVSTVGDLTATVDALRQLVADSTATGAGDAEDGPRIPLTRGTLAAEIVELLEEVSGAPLPARPHTFRDVSETDWPTAAKVIGTGIVTGLSGDRFEPDAPVSRAAFATFVARTLTHLVGEGHLAPRTQPAFDVPPGRVPFLPLPDADEDSYHLDVPERPDGTPARFNPCATVHVVVNPEGGPAGVEPALREALRRISEAMGTTWRYEGTTDERLEDAYASRPAYQPRRYGHRWAPVLVNWPQRWPDPEVLGLGGSRTVDDVEIITGDVRLNPDADLNGEHLVEVLMHELAHVAGLGHVEDTSQVMRHRLEEGTGAGTWGDGDLAALARVGKAAGCFTGRPPG